MKVHTTLAPGWLESVYKRCLKDELAKRGLRIEAQVRVPVVYDGLEIEGEYKIGLLVEDLVVMELTVVEQQLPIHRAQLLSHLKLTHKEVGVLINVNVVHLRDGISSAVVV